MCIRYSRGLYFWYLGKLVYPTANAATNSAMLKFHMDESGLGKNRDEQVCCVGGFATQNSSWKTFQKNWSNVLAEYGIDEFHSKEFWQRRKDGGLCGKYAEWSFAKANRFMGRLLRLISSYNLHLLSGTISLEDFFSYPVSQRKYLTGAVYHSNKQEFITSGKPNAAYFVPFNLVIIRGLELGAKQKEMVHFVFDEQNEFSPKALERIAEMRKFDNSSLTQFLGDTVYCSSFRVPALQCADLAAFTCREFYKRKMYGLPIMAEDRGVVTPMEVFGVIIRRRNHRIFKLQRAEMDGILKKSTIDLKIKW